MNKNEEFVCTKGWEEADEESLDGASEEGFKTVVGWARAGQTTGAEEGKKSCDMICAQHRGHQRGKGAKE